MGRGGLHVPALPACQPTCPPTPLPLLYRPTQVNVASLEDVIKYLLKVASDRAEAASKAAEAKLDVEVRAPLTGAARQGTALNSRPAPAASIFWHVAGRCRQAVQPRGRRRRSLAAHFTARLLGCTADVRARAPVPPSPALLPSLPQDLEAESSPEEMMLSYVSGEKSKDRTDRELVTPWFKFLWETYR